MPNYLELPTGSDVPNVINAIIEIPKGSSNKYEYDKKLNIFRLDRTLYSPVHYPGAYGFIPQTHSEDGDPLDVVVIVEHDTFPGCLIEVRPVGVLVMRDDMGLDHKILAVPVNDPRMRDVHGLQHLARHYLAEVDYFFQIYKDLEGKKSDTYGWEDRLVAHQVILESVQRFQDLKNGLIDRWNELTPKGKKSKEAKRILASKHTSKDALPDSAKTVIDKSGNSKLSPLPASASDLVKVKKIKHGGQ